MNRRVGIILKECFIYCAFETFITFLCSFVGSLLTLHMFFFCFSARSLNVLRIGVMEPGALLNDAYKEYEVWYTMSEFFFNLHSPVLWLVLMIVSMLALLLYVLLKHYLIRCPLFCQLNLKNDFNWNQKSMLFLVQGCVLHVF